MLVALGGESKNFNIQTLRVKVHDAKSKEIQILKPDPSACPEGDAIQWWFVINNTNHPRKDILLRKTVNRASRYLQPSEKKVSEKPY